jgi:hypothetical protein
VKAGAERFGQAGGEEDGTIVRIVVPTVQQYFLHAPVSRCPGSALVASADLTLL